MYTYESMHFHYISSWVRYQEYNRKTRKYLCSAINFQPRVVQKNVKYQKACFSKNFNLMCHTTCYTTLTCEVFKFLVIIPIWKFRMKGLF